MEEKIGQVVHYFDNIGVAVIKITGELKVGNTIRVSGPTTDFEQKVESMQVNHETIDRAGSGEDVGLKVKEMVKEGDSVYLMEQ